MQSYSLYPLKRLSWDSFIGVLSTLKPCYPHFGCDRVFPSETMRLFVFEWVIHGQAASRGVSSA